MKMSMAITGDCNFLKNILGFYLQYQFFENFLGLNYNKLFPDTKDDLIVTGVIKISPPKNSLLTILFPNRLQFLNGKAEVINNQSNFPKATKQIKIHDYHL